MVAVLLGVDLHGAEAYWISLAFTHLGAAFFSLVRSRDSRIPQEAIIGITYAVASVILFAETSGQRLAIGWSMGTLTAHPTRTPRCR